MTLYVAVVDRGGAASHRADGDWAAFTGTDRDQVIRRALEARNRWGRHTYRVVVGELTGEVREPVKYKIVPL